MASATKQIVETIKSVTLTLTLEEARTLAVVLAFVSGPASGPHGHVEDVRVALSQVGIHYGNVPEFSLLTRDSSSVRFSNYPAEP